MSRALVACVLLLLAACQASGPAESRIGYRFQWLGYLQGDDIRRSCSSDAGDRVRLIYNADFNRMTRTFDLFIADGGTGILETRLWKSSASLVLNSGSLNGAMEPEQGKVSLSADQVRALTDAFQASGFPGPVPVGSVLRSDAYFWVALACVDGVFGVQVWQGEALREIGFAGLLEQLDPIGQPLPPAVLTDLPPFESVVAANRRNGDASLLFYQVDVQAAALPARWRS